ncbi:TlpA family protein disulfide reductase [bacterium]|nr:TlpA family protein disulfide reductase [bacterium]
MGLQSSGHLPRITIVALTLQALLLLTASAVAQDTASAPELQPVNADQVLELVRGHDDGPVLVNMWATWCKPCREEMPDLLKLYQVHRENGFKLLLVSADFTRQKDKAAEFLGSLGVNFQTYLKDQKDNEFINAIDPDWSGALPFSVLFAKDGSVIRTWEGMLTYEEVDDLLTR